MRLRNFTTPFLRRLPRLALCGAALAVAAHWPLSPSANAKEGATPPAAQPGAENPDVILRAERGVVVDVPDIAPPEKVNPSIPFGSTPGSRDSQVLIGGFVGSPQPQDSTSSQQALQNRLQELQRKQQQLSREYQQAVNDMLQAKPQPQSIQFSAERLELQKRLSEAKAQINDLSSRQEHIMVAPLPDNAVLRAFTLKYVKPDEIGQALHNITGGGGPRIAVDERTNALLIAGNDKQLAVADQLVQTLDQPGADQKGTSSQTLQVRLVWIVDGLPGTEGRSVERPFVSPQVLDGLMQLGFETPRVMCQQVSMLTLEDKRVGQFHFQLPVLVQGDSFLLDGQGTISPPQGDRYSLQFNLALRQPGSDDCQLSGSIVTPLAHYNVLGTTTFLNKRETTQPDGGKTTEPEQHLSAFVIYIDHPKEFGSDASESKSKKN